MKNTTKSKYEIIFEKIMDRIPNSIKHDIKLKSTRDLMPKTSFLIEEDKKFPIKNPGDTQYNPKLVYAAYIKSKLGINSHPEYEQISESALKLFKSINGHQKVNFKIDEKFAENDKDILNAIKILEGKYEEIDEDNDIDDKHIPVDEFDHCICSECGYDDVLDIDDEGLCEEKTCPKCGQKSMLHSMNLESNLQYKLHNTKDFKNKMKILVENTLENEINPSGYSFCKECNLAFKDYIIEQNNNVCPECGTNPKIINKHEFIFNESHSYCPKCLTIGPFSILENECPICQSIMINTKKINTKKDESNIPIED